MDSDDADTPEINHHAFMAQLARQKIETKRRHKERQKRAISDIKLTRFDGAVTEEVEKSNFASVCGRLVGAIFFLGIGIGALVYSVAKSPTDANFAKTTTPPPRTVNPFADATATSGIYVYETCRNTSLNSATCVDIEVHKLAVQWFQDDENKRLFLVQGKPGDVRYRKIYALRNILYTITSNAADSTVCTPNKTQNYTTFINSFGGMRLEYEGQQEMQDYNNTLVWEFSGTNPKGSTVFRYTSADYRQLNYGWKGYPHDEELSLKRYSYWFGASMRPDSPDAAVFDLPARCAASALQLTAAAARHKFTGPSYAIAG